MVYDVSDPSWGDKHPELNVEYVLYLTPEGYVLGFEPAEESIDQYLYVDDSDEELKDWVLDDRATEHLLHKTPVLLEVHAEYEQMRLF